MIHVKSAVGVLMDAAVYSVSDGFQESFFLIDIGDYDAVQRLLPHGANVRGVFITHGHHDHIMGLNLLIDEFPDCTVFASEECAQMLVSAKANLSAYVGMPFVYKGAVNVLHDGDRIQLFDGVTLTAISTPGHHPSCMSFLVGNYIFTGDAFIPGVKVVTNLPGGNKISAKESVAKIKSLSSGKIVCPGHIVKIGEQL